MSNLILLFVCLIIGIVLKKSKIIPDNFHTSLNAFVINISLSAFSLYYISKIELNSSVIYPVLVVWIGIFAAILFFAGLGKIFGWKSSLIGALIMCAGFGNTSFVGIPLIQAMYGEEGLKTVMLVDQPGFVALSTVGILVANFYSGSKDSLLKHLSKILKFPPFIAFVIALLLNLFIGLLFKLVLLPLLILVIYKYIFHQSGDVIDICILEAAMAPMITAAIIASAHDLEPKFCNLMVAVGIPLSILTVGIWHLLLPFL